jgi:hypothetical protein
MLNAQERKGLLALRIRESLESLGEPDGLVSDGLLDSASAELTALLIAAERDNRKIASWNVVVSVKDNQAHVKLSLVEEE